jgi:MFS family permease
MTEIRTAVGAVSTTIACVIPVFLVGGLAVQIGDELRFSPAGLGVVVSVYFGIGALASVPAGRLVERHGSTMTARAGIVVAATGLLAISLLARNLLTLAVLLAVSAPANALGQLASNAALARRIPPRRQGLSFGVKQSAVPLSTLVAGAAVPAVALTVGWRWAFALGAALALAALSLVPPDGRVGAPAASRSGADQATTALMVIGLAAGLAAGAASALATFLVDSSATRGLDPGLAGLVLTLGSAACVAGRLLGGWQADRRAGGHIGAVAGLLAAGAAGLALLALPGALPLVVGVLLGFGLGWSWPGLMTFAVVLLHPQAPAAATSITQTGVYAGGCLGPLAFGAAAAYAGYPTAWLSGATAMVFAAGLMLLGERLLLFHRGPRPGQ